MQNRHIIRIFDNIELLLEASHTHLRPSQRKLGTIDCFVTDASQNIIRLSVHAYARTKYIIMPCQRQFTRQGKEQARTRKYGHLSEVHAVLLTAPARIAGVGFRGVFAYHMMEVEANRAETPKGGLFGQGSSVSTGAFPGNLVADGLAIFESSPLSRLQMQASRSERKELLKPSPVEELLKATRRHIVSEFVMQLKYQKPCSPKGVQLDGQI